MIDGQQRFISLVMAGGKGSRLGPAYPRSLQAGGAVRRALPHHRLRALELRQLGLPRDLRADAVHVASLDQARPRNWGSASGSTSSSRSCRRRCGMGEFWYRGTADAVFQNLNLIGNPRGAVAGVRRRPHLQVGHRPDDRLPHPEGGPIATVACLPSEARRAQFGIVEVDEDWRIIGFQEKPSTIRSRCPAIRTCSGRWATTSSRPGR